MIILLISGGALLAGLLWFIRPRKVNPIYEREHADDTRRARRRALYEGIRSMELDCYGLTWHDRDGVFYAVPWGPKPEQWKAHEEYVNKVLGQSVYNGSAALRGHEFWSRVKREKSGDFEEIVSWESDRVLRTYQTPKLYSSEEELEADKENLRARVELARKEWEVRKEVARLRQQNRNVALGSFIDFGGWEV